MEHFKNSVGKFLIISSFLLLTFNIAVNGQRSFNVIKSIRRSNNETTECETALSCSVQTKLGHIIGKELKTVFGDPKNVKFCGYRGIPYAKAPIDDLRFKAPVAYGAWNETLKAINYGSICHQFSQYLALVAQTNLPNNEDCLFLNVFTPNPKSCNCNATNVPVLIFIYGGAFTEGDSSDTFYGPNLLLNKCVILVTFNYRLGAFGFLSLRTPEYSGNMGLKDQKLAIKWVKDNIAEFGGDPNRITVFGESAGGASSCYQVMNAESRMNFNQIYAMSGSALNYFALMKTFNHSNIMIDVARKNGKSISNQNELIKFIRTERAENILMYTPRIGFKIGLTVDVDWAPIIERPDDVEAFLTKDPREYYETEVNTVPTILSELSLEYLPVLLVYLLNPRSLFFSKNASIILPFFDLDQSSCAKELRPLIYDIKKFYFGGDNIDFGSIRQFARMASDINFGYHIQKTAALLSKQSSAPIRLQIHNQQTPLNILTSLPVLSSLRGNGHAEDICYLFYCKGVQFKYKDVIKYRDTYQTYMEANIASNVLVEFLVNYATNGNPSSETTSFTDDLYPPIGRNPYDQMRYVEITNTGTPVTGVNPNWEAFNLWTQIELEVDKIKKLSCNRKYHQR